MITENISTVCITGTSKGLGFALVQAFLKQTDCKIAAVTGNRNVLRKKLEGTESSDRVEVIEASITDESGRNMIHAVLKKMPELKILIHNAGKLLFKPFAEITEAELKDIYNVNVFAPFLLTQTLLPIMKNTHTIHISSVGGVDDSLKFPGLSAYSTSKAALNCLTQMLSEEFKDSENTFNCLAMGSVETEMFQSAFPGVSAASRPEEMASYIVSYAKRAPEVMRGKIISLSKSNP